MKYIDADKLIAYLKKTMESYKSQMVDPAKYPIDHIDLMAFLAREYQALIENITSLQQEQPEGIDGVVHHAISAHWILTDEKQLATALKEFPEGTKVELFIFTRKEGE